MKDFFQLAKYIYPYRVQAFLNIILNLISNVFALGVFGLLMPFMTLLFNNTKHIYVLLPWSGKESIQNNISYYLTKIIENQGQLRALLFVICLVVISSFLKSLFGYFASFFMAPVMNGVVRDFQVKIYEKILKLPIGYFSDERKGDIISRMTSDVQQVKFSVMSSLDMIFRDPLTIIIYLGFLFYLSPSLTLFALVMLPLGGGVIGLLGRKLKRESMAGQVKMGVLISILEETLSGLRIIKAFNAEKKMSARYQEVNNSHYHIVNKLTRRGSLSSPLSEFLGIIVVVTIIYYGCIRVFNKDAGMLTPEAFIAYLAVFTQILTPAKSLSTAWYNIQRGIASIHRINFIIDAEITIRDKEHAKTVTEFKDSIEYKNVSFKYTENEVLKDINLKIEKGKSVALVGQSGSGKSTMVDLIPRFYDIEQGDILIDGISIKDYKIVDLRELMGNVNQESILFNDTFYNNISFGVKTTTKEQVIAAAKVANAHDFIMASEMGYETNIGDRGGKLSGGQRQRVSIARAVLKNPPIMILDEATSALDTESEFLVQEALLNLMKNRTSIVIAHRLSTIKYVDEICVLHEGRIVERGKHEDLLALNGYYKKLYDLQMF
jgi:ATP-binding cassette, subfamily B, bacterial MsbA